MKHPAQYLGWDVGGTKCAAVVGDESGRVLARVQWPSGCEGGPAAMLARFVREAERLRAQFPKVEAVGVSIGGPLDTIAGVIYSPPHLPGWNAVPLKSSLEGIFGLPVCVEHDAIACLAAEALWGAARGWSHAAYLTAGTGCGAAVLCNGVFVRGPKGQSPELGHVRIAEDGPLCYGKRGCVESFCSGTGVALLAHMRFPRRFGAAADLREVERSARAGEPEGLAVVAESGKYLGRVCALLADMFALQGIVIGSMARYLPEAWLDAAREEMQRETLASSNTQIVPSACGEHLQDLSSFAPCVHRKCGYESNPSAHARTSPKTKG